MQWEVQEVSNKQDRGCAGFEFVRSNNTVGGCDASQDRP